MNRRPNQQRIRKTNRRVFYLFLAVLLSSVDSPAHFQMIIPSDDMLGSSDSKTVALNIMFWHPFEGHGMNMEKPIQFGVRIGGKDKNLLAALKIHGFKDINGQQKQGFKIDYTLTQPGNHIFYVESKPFWEALEETFVAQFAKVVVNGFGLEQGWDDELGLKTEIIPLTRPYGLYTGNIFQGVVKLNGKVVPNAVVEVEYFNQTGKLKAPANPMITQIVKADGNGVFSYVMPKAGWWGFAAINTDDKKMKHDGKEYSVELGAVIWVKTYPMQ